MIKPFLQPGRRRLHLPALRSTHGLTMMELIVAMSIILTIMVGVVWSFVELLDSHDRARARMEATANARAAMEVISSDVKRARNISTSFFGAFNGETVSTAGNGDRVDNDRDGAIDEEIFDGADDDAGWVMAQDDRHVILGPTTETQYYTERPVFYRHADLDDADIDEDLGETSATLQFDTFDTDGGPLLRNVRFYIGSDADGTPNTLMREVKGIDPVTSSSVTTTGPLCYNVKSFGVLFWNFANAKDPSANPWETKWPPAATPLTPSPSSVYLSISVYAGKPYSLQDLPAGKEVDTVTLTTVVNVESVLASPPYVTQRTLIPPATATTP
jgi:type II secretory pathway pseudopilin PulG